MGVRNKTGGAVYDLIAKHGKRNILFYMERKCTALHLSRLSKVSGPNLMKVYSIVNQKGGVAKTSTAQALSAGLKRRRKKVLVIDLDPSCNFTSTAGVMDAEPNIYDVLNGEATIVDCIKHTSFGDIVPGSNDLAGADRILKDYGSDRKLAEAFEPIKNDYDYVVIDTPPMLGVLSVNALVASDGIVVPANADIYSLDGIDELSRTIAAVKRYGNPNLKVEGILITQDFPRTILSRDCKSVAKEIASEMGTKVFKTAIRYNVSVKEAQAKMKTVFEYGPNDNAAVDYNAWITELLKN